MKGRQIIDGIIHMYEVLHSFHKKNKAIMVYKLDMEKAYDRVNWDFLDKILGIFIFGAKWREWAKEYINTSKFLVTINGEPIKL